MGETLRLETTLHPRGPAGAIVLTDEQAAAVGDGRKAFPVTVTVNDTVLQLRLARMGGENLIGLAKAARKQAGVEVGGTYTVTISADAAERTVTVPADLAAALQTDPAAATAFEAMAYSHRKEYVRWIEEAKREQTRADRIVKTVAMVREGRTR
ncbi:MAG: YdeI/OmpD-associated family protein [Acidimicrobiia bacterium]